MKKTLAAFVLALAVGLGLAISPPAFGALVTSSRPAWRLQTLTATNGGTVTPDGGASMVLVLAGSGVSSLTVGPPSGPAVAGMRTLYVIRNTSGGAVTVTWDAVFKMSAYTPPATGNQKGIEFSYDGTNWIMSGTPASVAN